MSDNKIAFPVSDAFYKLNGDNKLELHLPGKTGYSSLPEEIKKDIKTAFLWGRQRGAWVSRSKGGFVPYSMKKYKIEYKGADNVNSFEDMQERKAARAENKAERFERYAANADKRAESLKSEFNALRKDWSWLTQPITPGAGGQSFKRHKDRVMSRYDAGMRESIKANKMREYAASLEISATQSELNDLYYLQNRIKENTKIVKAWPDFDKKYTPLLDNPELKTDTRIWIDAALQRFKLAFDKLEYYQHYLNEIQAKNEEQGIVTDDEKLKYVKKNLKTYLKDKHALNLVSFQKAFIAKGSPVYMIRTDKDLPTDMQSGFSNAALAQISINKLFKMIKATEMHDNKKDDKPKQNTYIVPSKFAVQSFEEFVKKLDNGEINIEQLKQAFKSAVNSKDELTAELSKNTKEQLLKKMGSYGAARYKSEKKDRVIQALMSDYLMNFSFGVISYGMQESLQSAIAKKLEQTTQADIDEHVSKVQEHREKLKEKVKQYKKALENPETIEEFKIFIRANGLVGLSIEQKAKYDELVSDKVLDKRSETIEQKAVVKKVDIGAAELNIVESKHTKTGAKIWVVKISKRLDSETYKELSIKAKKLGGYYSSYSQNGAITGFIFTTKDFAEQFSKIDKQDATNIEYLEKRAEEKIEKKVSKLRENAENIIARVDKELSRDRLTNTAKRASEATHIEAKLNEEKRIAQTMLNIASAIENGNVKLLAGINATTHIQLLDGLIRRARYKQIHSVQNLTYKQRQELEGEPVTVECVEYLTSGLYPEIYVQRINDILKKVKDKKGLIRIAEKWAKKIAGLKGDEYFKVSSSEEMEELALMYSRLFKHEQNTIIGDYIADYKRLIAMGIENDAMLRAVLREYIQFRGKKIEGDKVKQLERSIAGRGKSVGIDFFPTPQSVARQMVESANIVKGMDVLEPSAGNGNIADEIKKAGVMPDVIEISTELTAILKAKGYNHVASDFIQFSGKKYDRIIMNPPFSNGMDGEHVQHAYSLLKPGGKVIAIIGEGTFVRSDKKAIAFRDWLTGVGGKNTKLKDGTFQDKTLLNTTGANARLVVISKAGIKVKEQAKPTTIKDMDTKQTPKLKKFSDVKEVDRSNIAIAPELFQGRQTAYSEDTVNKIVNEGYDKTDEPIVVWWSDNKNKYIVISGHSRFEASERLFKAGDKSLLKMPVKVFLGDQDDAVNFAVLESNRAGTAEGLKSDITAYKRAVKEGYNRKRLLGLFKPESYLNSLQMYSFLNPKGMFVEHLGTTGEKSFPYLRRNAEWVGALRKQYPNISDEHETEMFKYLYNKNGLKVTKQQFYDLVQKKVQSFFFDATKPLNLNNVVSTNPITDSGRLKVKEIEQEIEKLNRERIKKEEILARAKREKITQAVEKIETDLKGINRVIREKVERKQQLESQLNTLERSTVFDLFSQPQMVQPPAKAKKEAKRAERPKRAKAAKAVKAAKAAKASKPTTAKAAKGKRFTKEDREKAKKLIQDEINELAKIKHPKHDDLLRIARRIHAMRSFYSQIVDGMALHKKTMPVTPETLRMWANRPGSYDLIGVDAPSSAKITHGLNHLKDIAKIQKSKA